MKSVTIPQDIQAHVFKSYELIKPGERLDNYMNERVGYIYYAYDRRDEIIDAVEHFNDRIQIEFED